MKHLRMLSVMAAAFAFAVIVCVVIGIEPSHASAAGHALQAGLDLAPLFISPVTVLPGTDLKALQGEHKRIVGEMRGILEKAEKENRDLTAEEEAAYDALEAQLDPLKKKIGRADGLAAEEAHLATVRPAAGRQNGIHHPQGPEAKKEFEHLGQFLHAVRFNPNDQRLHFVEGVGAAQVEGELSAEQRMDDGPSGGFMIPPQLRQTIMSVPAQEALVRPRANVLEAGSPPDAGVTMPALDQTGANPANMHGGMEFRWIAEGEEKPETGAKLREITLTPNEIAGFVTVTDKLLRNWQASRAFLENLMRGGVNAAEDYAFLRGTGVGQPLGAINSGAMKFINRTTANQITYDDTLQMVSRLLMRGGQPVWSMPQSALVPLGKMVDPEGHYVWKANAREGFAGDLHGYPVRWNNRSPSLGSKGDVTLSDWSHYLVKDGSGPFVAASEHVLFKSNKTIIKIFWNVDGAPWLTAPIKEENGYEVSPFVGLDVPG